MLRPVCTRGLALALLLTARATPAQGVSDASVRGSVVAPSGAPLANARVTLRHARTGAVREMVTGERGGFTFENVPVGGPYLLEARSLGFEPATIYDISLHVGDQMVRRFVLGATALRLDDILVRGSPLRDAGAGGAAYAIPGSVVRSLPLLDRNFVGLFALAPQGTGNGDLSIGGQHRRLNAIQVDGGSAGDFFGVSNTPGAAAGARALSLEALEELRLLVAPFDVRQGGFAGGLINAVTRSGTNQLGGSALLSLTNAQLVGRDTAGAASNPFNSLQYGLSAGGPVVRDRLHFFVAIDLQSRRTPFAGPSASDPATGISAGTAQLARRVFSDRYGIDAGGPDAPTLDTPNGSLFVKFSWQPSSGHRVELSHNVVNARSDQLNRTVRNRNNRDGWQLANSGSVARADLFTTRLKATSVAGPFTNEFIASAGVVDSRTDSRQRTPLFLVQGDVVGNYLAGGSVKGAQGTDTRQRIVEFADNLSWSRGTHLFTVGTQEQLLHFRDNFFLGAWGVWTFGNVDSLDLRLPSRYEVALPVRPGGPLADYSASNVAGYLQDRWSVSARATLTFGVRVDVPFFEVPSRNPALAANESLGRIDTGVFPSGNAVLSPRLGFALDVGRDHATLLRGGAGGFTGRPPYAWLSAAYANTGREQSLLVCDAASGVPAPVTDITALPSRCPGTTPTSPVPSVSVFDRGFHFPQAVKYDLGLDHDFGRGLTGSLDVIQTRTANTSLVRDVNLIARGSSADGRVMYGTISVAGVARPTRIATGFGAVYRFENVSADRATAVTATVQKQWASGAQLQAGYQWSRTDDVMSAAGFTGSAIFQNNPIDGTITDRRLRRSARDIPHNLVVTATAPPVLGVTGSLWLRARSGTPYAYVASGDANADGAQGNDLAYVPRDASDISLANPAAWPALDAFVESEGCLRRQRGRIMARNSCRNPSVQSLDVRLTRNVRLGGAQNVEVSADFFNVANLLNASWGLVREATDREVRALLVVSGWDPVASRPVYTVPTLDGRESLPGRGAVVVDESRWRMQLGLRYRF